MHENFVVVMLDMDLTPPSLTRSPASPPNTYCASESSLEYPSPVLLGQQYKISSPYGSGPSCSMAEQLDPDTSLPPLDAMTQSAWNSPTIMAASASSAAMPNVLSAEYDPFANYESPLPAPYSHDVYPPPPSHGASSPTASGAEGPAPSPGPTSRSPFHFSHHTSAPASLAPRLKVETAGGEYSALEVSHYPSPRSIHAPYVSEPSPYPATPSTFLGEPQAQSWPKPPEYESPGAYYANATGAASAFVPDRRMRVNRPRRAPRRLTTKEEANFQCEVKGCGKLFSRSYNFKAHMETHDEKREYPFPCPVSDCNKKFVRKTDLQRHHQSVHMKERSHKCDYCSRLFARKDTLRRHMEDGCSKRFDIGTLDLRAEGYDRPLSGPSGPSGPSGLGHHHMMSSPGVLPPMAIPPNAGTSMLSSGPRPMRGRGGASDMNHAHGWSR